MDLKERVLSGLRWSASTRILGQLISWSTTIIVMRLLTPSDYGLMAMAGIFVSYLSLVNEFGLGEAVIQGHELSEIALRQIFAFLLLINLCSFLFLLLTAPLVATFFDEPRIVSMIRLLSTQFIVVSFAIIPQALQDRAMQFKKRSLIDFVSIFMGSVSTLILAIKGYGVWALVYGNLLMSLCKTIGLNIFCPFLKLPCFSFRGMGKIVSFGGYVTFRSTLWFLLTQADIFIVGRLLGHELLGFYSVGANLASMPMDKISGIVNQVASPAFSQIQTDPQKVASHFLKSIRLMSFLIFPVLWGMSSLAPELVHTLLGDKWLLASVPFQLLCLVIPIRMLASMITPALTATGHPDIAFSNVLLASVVMPLALIAGSQWGLAGVSLAWVMIFPLVFLRNLSRSGPALGIKIHEVLLAMARPAFAAFLMYIAVITIHKFLPTGHQSIVYLLLLAGIGAVVYGGVVLSVHRQGLREILSLARATTRSEPSL